MKPLITLLLISFTMVGMGQTGIVSDWTPGKNKHLAIGYDYHDSLTAERFFLDSLGNQYMVNYTYADEGNGFILHSGSTHSHYIAMCSIIKYHGNKQTTIASNIKAIYSPVECSADCPKLWLTRLYNLKNKKQ